MSLHCGLLRQNQNCVSGGGKMGANQLGKAGEAYVDTEFQTKEKPVPSGFSFTADLMLLAYRNLLC